MSRLRSIRLVATVAAALALSANLVGAAPVVVLHADFDQDTVDQMPSTDPPGEPDGDSLALYHSAGDILVRSAVGTMTNQPVELSRTGGIGGLRLTARLDPDYTNCSAYTVSFRSMVRSSVFFVYMVLRASDGLIICSLEYRAGGVLSYNTVNNDLSVGYVPDVPQFFEITVDMSSHRTSLSIDGAPIPEAQDMGFSQSADDFATAGPTFGGQYVETMVFDDFHIEATGCTSPVEPSTWGRVKNTYR